ncbi:MAG: TrkA family potassium uptake protein [Mobilitalea sp.]
MYIILIGCGRLGRSLAKGLSDDGNDVSVIDRDNDKLNSLGSGFNGQRIRGIEFDSEKLIEAGIEKADALIAVTADDNVNITVSLIADKIFHVPKIIARINDPEKNYIYNKLGISVINPIQYEMEILKSQLPIRSLDVISTLDNNYDIIKLLINKKKSIYVRNIEEKYECVVSSVIKNGTVRLPKNNEQINNGDSIICTIQKKDKAKLINYLCKEMFV